MESKQSLPLSNKWSIWYTSRKEKDYHIPYESRIMELCTFDTMETFLKSYIHLKPIDKMEKNNDIAIFKKGYKPIWESCVDGGMWFYRFTNPKEQEVNYIWEKIVFALIGEQFDEPNILGVLLSIRSKETIIELWINYFNNDIIKNKVVDKFAEILSIDVKEKIFFKDIKKSMYDKSTLRGAESHMFKAGRKFTYG